MSVTAEAGHFAVLEAAPVGAPIVGTAIEHIAEWSPHVALAVPGQDSAALADALESILNDEDLRMRLASEALGRADRDDADRASRAIVESYRRSADVSGLESHRCRKRAARRSSA